MIQSSLAHAVAGRVPQDYKDSVRVATAAALPAYTKSGAGVGARLTANANGALTVDVVVVAANDRVLNKDSGAGADNGIFFVVQPGTAGTPWILQRTDDCDGEGDVTSGMLVPVEEGAVGSDRVYALTTNAPITVDTTALSFSDVSALATGWTDDGTVVRLTTATDTVAIGIATMQGSEKVRVRHTASTTMLLESTVAGAQGVVLELEHDKGGVGVNNDVPGQVDYYGFDAVPARTLYGRELVRILDVTDTSEDAEYEWSVMGGGTLRAALQLRSTLGEAILRNTLAAGGNAPFHLRASANYGDGQAVFIVEDNDGVGALARFEGDGDAELFGQVRVSPAAGPTAPFLLNANAQSVVVVGLEADEVDGAHAAAVPAASTIPIADVAGKLAVGWISEVLAPADLTGVSGTTGGGTTLVFNDTPTLLTPTIASFVNALHSHQNAAGGSKIDHGLAIDGLLDDDHTQYILVAGTRPFTGNQSVGGFRLTSLGAPVASSDAARKQDVDDAITGLDMKQSVRLATAAALPANTAAGSGVGKTLTMNAVGVLPVDGVATVLNDRILVKDEAAGANNGPYLVTTEGTGAVAAVLTRTTDADQNAEVTTGMYVFVSEGTTNADSGWALQTNDPITVDTTALVFVQFTGLGQVTAGAGLTKTGNTINVIANADGSIVVNADDVQLGRVAGATAPVAGATAAIYGIVRITPAPAVADTPIAVGSNRSVATSGGLSGGGDLTADRTLSVNEAFAFTWDADHQWAKSATASSTATQARSFRARYTASTWTGAAEAERDFDVYAGVDTGVNDTARLRVDYEGQAFVEVLPTSAAPGAAVGQIQRNQLAAGAVAGWEWRRSVAMGVADVHTAWTDADVGTVQMQLLGDGSLQVGGASGGVVGNPALAFVADPDTGLRRAGSGQIRIVGDSTDIADFTWNGFNRVFSTDFVVFTQLQGGSIGGHSVNSPLTIQGGSFDAATGLIFNRDGSMLLATGATQIATRWVETFAPVGGASPWISQAHDLTVNQTGGATGQVTAQRISVTETAVAAGTHYFLRCLGGAGGATERFAVELDGDVTQTSSDAGALGTAHEQFHDSASPAASDVLARWAISGRSSTAVKREYGRIDAINVDPTNAGEDARWDHYAMVAGASTLGLSVGSTGTAIGVGFLGAAAVARQTGGENLTNNVTAGGVDGTVADFATTVGDGVVGASLVDLTTVANQADVEARLASIRNDIYQLARTVKQDHDALRLYGFLT